jgi:hypothetical protein
MVWHTLKEAMTLTGRSRRSLYRDMATGLISYSLGTQGHRQLETSELMRAYGAFVSVAHAGTPNVAHTGTPETAPPWDQLLAELQALRQEVQELKSTVLRLEYKPNKPDEMQPKPLKPATWAGLLDALDD